MCGPVRARARRRADTEVATATGCLSGRRDRCPRRRRGQCRDRMPEPPSTATSSPASPGLAASTATTAAAFPRTPVRSARSRSRSGPGGARSTVGDVRLRAAITSASSSGRPAAAAHRYGCTRAPRLRRLLSPISTQAAMGNELVRGCARRASSSPTPVRSSPAILRSVNWRASARRGDLVVNERPRSGTRTSCSSSTASRMPGVPTRRHPRASGAGERNPRRPLPPPSRPGRPGLVRRHPALARAARRRRAELPPYRRPARDVRRATPGRT